METNSPADTDQPLPAEGEPVLNIEERPDEPSTPETGAEQKAAAAEGVPEPLPELSTTGVHDAAGQADESLEEYNVTEETAADPDDEPGEALEGGETGDSGASEAIATGERGTLDPLQALAEQAQRARLSAPDEERATALLKEVLLDGRAGVTRAVAILPNLPWVIGVSAVSAIWKEMKTAFRTQLLSGLGKSETDAARRMRLSLARGLFKVDVPTALKLAVAVAKEMRDKETGAMTPKNAQIFANVLIGRAKPWVAQIPLNELKPAEADLLVHCALISSFTVPHAPVTQLGVIKWAAAAGRLVKLHELALESTTRGLGRWSAKWQAALRKEVADLPEAIAEALKAPAPESSEEAGQTERRERSPRGSRKPAPPERPENQETDGRDAPEEGERDAERTEDVDDDEEDERADSAWKARLTAAGGGGGGGGREQGRPRPVYESKTVPRKPAQAQESQAQPQVQQPPQQGRGAAQGRQAAGPFDLRETLRQIESHVAGLRSELANTQSKLRQREQEPAKSKRGPERAAAAPIIPGEPTPDELARLNLQLEGRNAELQQRIAELTQDSEDRAASMGRHGSEPVEQPDAQLRTLLSLKLQDDYEDFAALEKEKPDLVVQQHYRTLLSHVLDVLRQEGVEFQDRRGE